LPCGGERAVAVHVVLGDRPEQQRSRCRGARSPGRRS
jgi:hypothetical protein